MTKKKQLLILITTEECVEWTCKTCVFGFTDEDGKGIRCISLKELLIPTRDLAIREYRKRNYSKKDLIKVLI